MGINGNGREKSRHHGRQLSLRDQVSLEPFYSFACDQDTGGAIRSAGRCDIYMGVGNEALLLAGRTRHEGKLYYLAMKR